MQCDAGAHPGFILVEINAHHFALAHPDEIVYERWIAILVWPHKHHSNLSLRFVAIDGRYKRGVIDFPLQNLFVRILQAGDFFLRRLHVYTVAGE